MAITFEVSDVDFRLREANKLRNWIDQCITHFEYEPGELAYTFVSDERLYEINLEYLNHDTYTDIITFDYTVGSVLSSDIFISVDRIRENAAAFDTSQKDELHRVMIHGVLHLMGHKDKTDTESREMRKLEDFCLTLRDF